MKKMKPSDLARVAGLRPSSVHRYEAGRDADPRGSSLERLAEALEVSVDYLRGLEPELDQEPFEVVARKLSFKRFLSSRPNLSKAQRLAFERLADLSEAPRTFAEWDLFDRRLQGLVGPRSPLTYKGAKATTFRRAPHVRRRATA